MADNPELGRRLRDAKRGWEQRHDYDLSWRELGERIGAEMGREAYAYQVVQRWFQLGREPGDFVDTLAAIARVLDTDPRELAFGPSDANGRAAKFLKEMEEKRAQAEAKAREEEEERRRKNAG